MKMSYEHKINNKSSLSKYTISLIIKILIPASFILLLIYFIFPNLFSAIFSNILSPIWTIQKRLSEKTISIPPEIENPTILELQKENRDLKALLNRVSDTKKQILAYILKKPPFSAYDIFIIDIGKNTNIEVGDKVYALGNILIGEIGEVNNNTSKVKLYSSYGEKFEALIGDNKIQATITGKGGGSFEVTLPRDINLREGDNVLVPDKNNSILGVIQVIIPNPAKAFSNFLISQPINLYEQKWVIVEKNAK